MPNRILKESICISETIDGVSAEAERFFYRLLVQCDDYGRMDGRASVLRARCFPLKLDTVTEKHIEAWLKELIAVDLLWLYQVEGKTYIQVTTWERHQQKRAKYSKYPDHPVRDMTTPAVQSNDSTRNHVPAIVSEKREYENTRSEKREDTRAAEKTAGAGVADAPPPQPPTRHREPSAQDTTRRALREHFTSVTGLPPPQESSKAAGAAWYAPLRNIAEMAVWDRDVGCELITAAVARLDGEHLTIADPRSIVKTAAAILGERRRGVVSANGTGPPHEKQTGFDRSKRAIQRFVERGADNGRQDDSGASGALPGSSIPKLRPP